MSYLRYLCLLAHSGVQYILGCVFLRVLYPMLPVSLDCPFMIAPSVFSNVYSQSTIKRTIFVFNIKPISEDICSYKCTLSP
jgi:hypothetical protein